MNIDDPSAYRTASELEIMEQYLPLRGARVLELGCGRAWMTHRIAERFLPAAIIATEVDRIQHEKNLLIDDLPNVDFVYGGAERIDQPTASVDIVLMLKSLHHVPQGEMEQALLEVARVLKPGGLAYISEPVYRGEFNDILKLFHDEREVRQAAFNALENAVAADLLRLEAQIFFDSPGQYRDFREFEQRIINVTHTEHRIAPQRYEEIRQAFECHMEEDGARFLKPSRVDLLRKPQ